MHKHDRESKHEILHGDLTAYIYHDFEIQTVQ